ncbi:unnamed protein product [Ambrosiozyma monospora]|uniref:Unnamed protein product n=1 Tax=Ambrosiozyma monospora TaxID=43982 RepID=A0ACB5U9K7_AMBMO|nr:unnamed protein product [Ambrosiozyma monospora]
MDSDVKQLYKFVLKELWEECDSLDSFFDYLANCSSMVLDSEGLLMKQTSRSSDQSSSNEESNTNSNDDKENSANAKKGKPIKLLTNSSYLGKFVCMMSISYEMMHFDEMLRVWNAFYDFREDTRKMWNNLLSKEGKQQLKLSIASTPAGKSTARGRARAPLSTVTNDRLGEDPEAESLVP